MPTFLITYHGGAGMPASVEGRQQALAAFQAWAASVADNMIDPGAPLGAAKAVSSSGVSDDGDVGPASGYTLISAESMDAAVAAVSTADLGVPSAGCGVAYADGRANERRLHRTPGV